MVQQLGLPASTTGAQVWPLVRELEFPHSAQYGKKKKKRCIMKQTLREPQLSLSNKRLKKVLFFFLTQKVLSQNVNTDNFSFLILFL